VISVRIRSVFIPTCRIGVVEHAVAWFKASQLGGALLVDSTDFAR